MSMSEIVKETNVDVAVKEVRRVKVGMKKIDIEDLGYTDYNPEISYIHSFDIYIEEDDEWIDCEGMEHETNSQEYGNWWRVPRPDDSNILEQLFHYEIKQGDWVPFKYKLLLNGEATWVENKGELCWRGSGNIKDSTVEFRV